MNDDWNFDHDMSFDYSSLDPLFLVQLSMNLTLTLADDGTPKFFNCALTSL